MKTIYFADVPWDGTVKSEWRDLIVPQFKHYGIDPKKHFGKVIVTDLPPFKGGSSEQDYDTLIFDWGGMSIGNSMLEHFCQYILDEAREHPSRIYIMASAFTRDAMEDLQSMMRDEKFPNIYLSIENYCKSVLTTARQ